MTYNEKEQSTEEKKGWTPRFILITFSAYLIIPAIGYCLATLNAPSQLIKDFMNATDVERTGSPMEETTMDSNFGLLVAVLGVSAAVASITGSTLSDRLGRKNAILITVVVSGAGILLMSLAQAASAYEMLFVGRVLIGFGCGWALSLAPTYVMEMCEPDMKGAAAMANQLSQSFSFLVAQVLGYEELLGNEDLWSILLGIPLVLVVLQLIIFPFCPESPRYLLINKKEKEAEAALQKIHGTQNVDVYLNQMKREIKESSTDDQVSIIGLFRSKILLRPLMIAVAMGLHQNWCGTNTILYFSNDIFNDAGIAGKASRYATSGTGAIFLAGNIIATFLMTRFGRKTLFIGGTAGIGLCCAVLSLTLMFKEEVEALKYVNIVVSLLNIACYALGPICVYWVILGEVFPHSARGAGFSVAILCAMFGFFTHGYALPAIMEAIGSYAFFVFTGIDILMIVFCVIYMPETKGKDFEQIASAWTTKEELQRKGSVGHHRLMELHVPSPEEAKANNEVGNGTTFVDRDALLEEDEENTLTV